MNNPFNPLFDVPLAPNFKAILANEIRNPLATIDLSLELILEECNDDGLKVYIGIIQLGQD